MFQTPLRVGSVLYIPPQHFIDCKKKAYMSSLGRLEKEIKIMLENDIILFVLFFPCIMISLYNCRCVYLYRQNEEKIWKT